MKRLSVLLLGIPEVYADGSTLEIQPPIARALFFHLASYGGMADRELLRSLFWENEPPSSAQQRLEENLQILEQVLPEPGFIRTGAGLVGLDFEKIYVDQLEFQDLVDQAGRIPWQIPSQQPLPEKIYQRLAKAVRLWRVPHYLAGADFPYAPGFENWLARTTLKIERTFSRLAERLTEHAYLTGDFDASLEFSRLALALDKFNDNIHELVLRLLIQTGRLPEALTHFKDLEALLRRELNTSPSPRLVNLYREIRGGQTTAPSPRPSQDWRVRQSVQVPFIGRKQLLDQLDRTLETGGGVLIFGESGLGKTRLLQEFTSKIEPPPRLLLTACRPVENNLPFQPLINIFRHQILPEEWVTLSPAWSGQLSLLLPEISTAKPGSENKLFDADSQLAPDQTRTILFEAIRQVFLHLAQQQRLILCLDDAQWSDEATLATLAYLLDRPPFVQNGLLLLTARQEENTPRLGLLAELLKQADKIKLLQLTRLAEEEIRDLVRYLTGFTPSDQLTLQLANETGGNPLFILETLHTFLESEVQVSDQQLYLPLAKSLQTLIKGRLSHVTPSAMRVLEAAAILGTNFSPEVLAGMSQQAMIRVGQALEELERRLLIEPLSRNPEDVRYRFVHDKIREVLLENLSPSKRSLLHGRAAKLLENYFEASIPEHAAILAQHFEKAGEPKQAFDYWLRAGRYARHLFSLAEAFYAFSRAEKQILNVPDLPDDLIHDLYSEWTELAYEVEDAETIRRINTALLQLGEQRRSPSLIGTALDGLSDACMVANNFYEGLKYSTQAIGFLEQSDNLYELVESYNHRGVFLYMLSRIEEAIESFQDALTLTVEATHPQLLRARANAHYQISVARVLSGWPEIARNHALRSLADNQESSRAHDQVLAYSALALARFFLGEYTQAQQDCQAGIEIAERLRAWRMLGYLHAYRSMIEAASGYIDEALESAFVSIQLGERYGHAEIAAGGYQVIGDLYAWLERHDLAIEYYQRGRKASENNFMAANLTFRLGFSLCIAGQVEAGLEYQKQSLQTAKNTGQVMILLLARLSQILIDQLQGEWQCSREGALELLDEVEQRSIPSLQLYSMIALGKIALRDGNLADAEHYFHTVAIRAVQLPQPWLGIEALLHLQKTYLLAGRSDPTIGQRIQLLLAQIDSRVTREPFREFFLTYRARLSVE